MTGKTKQFRVSSLHVEDLDDGRIAAPGSTVSLTKEQEIEPHNQNLIREGKLVLVSTDEPAVPEPTEAAKKKATELGVNIAGVKGTGADNRVTVEDVEKAAPESDGNDNSEEKTS